MKVVVALDSQGSFHAIPLDNVREVYMLLDRIPVEFDEVSRFGINKSFEEFVQDHCAPKRMQIVDIPLKS